MKGKLKKVVDRQVTSLLYGDVVKTYNYIILLEKEIRRLAALKSAEIEIEIEDEDEES